MRGKNIGAGCLVAVLPLLLAVSAIAATGWHDPVYNIAHHNISDLGNVACGVWDTSRPRLVCSPWHQVFNVGAIVCGVLLGAGLLLTWGAFGRGARTRVAQSFALSAAVAYVLVGAYPADLDENMHLLAALLIFFPGNMAMLFAAAGRGSPSGAVPRFAALGLGLSGAVGAVLFLMRVDLGIGLGGMERVAMYPLLIWAFVIGIWLLATNRLVARSLAGADR